MFYPDVLTEVETLEALHQGKSIARYGDGELKLCRKASIKCQEYDAELSLRLQKILRYESDNCLVAIPRIQDKTALNPEKHPFWAPYEKPPYVDFYNRTLTYGSAFITRPDSIPAINTKEYFKHIQQLWNGRDVILINGTNRPFDKHPTFLTNAASVARWDCPSQNAWAVYKRIFKNCTEESKDTLFILSAGPTATVLAYDLSEAGYQALDLGHIGMYYNRFMTGHEFKYGP